MGCIGAVKRALVRLGVLPSFTREEMSEAHTDDLIIERERTMGELVKQTETFKAKSESLVGEVGRRKIDLESVLDHIKQASVATADARSLIESMLRSKSGTH